MVKRTTINLDMELVAQARGVLEAGNTTDTVHAALRDVVRRDRLRRLSERDWNFTLEDLKEMRRSRVETRPWGDLNADFSDIGTPGLGAPPAGDPVLKKPKKAA
jgi:Arc/MetJ family transcription regulator